MAEQDILFVNGAIQNQAFTLEEKPYKTAGIFAASVLNELMNVNAPEVHCWNNVGMFDAQISSTPEERLAVKYSGDFARTHFAERSNIKIETDDGEGFSSWAKTVVATCLESGSLYVERAECIACKDCDITIAEAIVPVEHCSSCNTDDALTRVEELGLFSDTRDAQQLLPAGSLFNAINVRHEMSTFAQLPPRFMLSRTRSIGIELDEFGLRDRKLDPRLGIGLLALYTAQKYGFRTAGIVQSISTLNRIAPYLCSAIPNADSIGVPDAVFALHAKIAPSLFGSALVSPRDVALYALGQRSDILASSETSISQETTELTRRYKILAQLLDGASEAESSVGTAQTSEVTDFTKLIPRTSKNLGRAIEVVKRGRATTEEYNTANRIHQNASVLRRALRVQ